MKHIHKEYQQPFLLEPTKLNRVAGKIHERLADHTNSTLHDRFEVFLTGSRREEMTTVDDVLALDNSRKHKIERLVIVCSASTPRAARPEHEVQIDFGYPKPSSTTPNSNTKLVAVSVRSDDNGWASRTLSEVEEQAERTWMHYSWPIGSLIVLIILLLAVLLFLTFPLIPFRAETNPNTLWLMSSDVDRIHAMLGEHSTLTDENLREIVTMQVRNVFGPPRPLRSAPPNQVTRTVFLGLPLLVVFVCALVLTRCYPSAVFLWGDEVERYTNTVQRRKIIWNIIVGVTVMGVLSKFLFEGLSSYWLPRWR
jgi:hypothetical protein